jgi:hypothetical protein
MFKIRTDSISVSVNRLEDLSALSVARMTDNNRDRSLCEDTTKSTKFSSSYHS